MAFKQPETPLSEFGVPLHCRPLITYCVFKIYFPSRNNRQNCKKEKGQKRDRNLQFTNLLHHIDTERLHGAYRVLNHKASVGVDGVTWREYGEGLNKRDKCLGHYFKFSVSILLVFYHSQK